ncbi:hypothetical protein PANA5342_3378 [Pantoea ananatis LMG 5342]|nr:hypothetical protein PANA5342_3378 [Pantoea ananatis LMG 5342]
MSNNTFNRRDHFLTLNIVTAEIKIDGVAASEINATTWLRVLLTIRFHCCSGAQAL